MQISSNDIFSLFALSSAREKLDVWTWPKPGRAWELNEKRIWGLERDAKENRTGQLPKLKFLATGHAKEI